MGNRIKDFTIIMQDAWFKTYFYSQLEERLDGTLVINACRGDEVHSIEIKDQNAFVKTLTDLKIQEMDNVYYNWGTEDAGSWALRIKYDNKEVISAGSFALPKEYKKLVKLLGYDMDNHPSTEKEKWWGKKEKMTCESRIDNYLMLKEMNRIEEDLWIEPEHNYQALSFKSDNYGRYRVGVNGNRKELSSFYD